MIRYLSCKLAAYVVKNDGTADFETLAYGYDLLFQEIGVVAVTLLLALPFGLFFPVLLSTVSYHLVRRYAGGAHASRRPVCVATSFLILFGPSFVFTKLNWSLPLPAMLGLYLIGLILLSLYAPADTEIKPVQNPRKRRQLKIAAILCLSVCAALALYIRDFWDNYASILITVPAIVCSLTHPLAYRLLGCAKSNKSMEVTK